MTSEGRRRREGVGGKEVRGRRRARADHYIKQIQWWVSVDVNIQFNLVG